MSLVIPVVIPHKQRKIMEGDIVVIYTPYSIDIIVYNDYMSDYVVIRVIFM